MGWMDYFARQIFRSIFGSSIEIAKGALGNGNKEKFNQAQSAMVDNDCVIDGCNAMKYQESQYCLRHHPRMVSDMETGKPDTNGVDQQNWWDESS
ncbi:MAG: hypothetical protein CMB75_05435 [Euryarchaeota archaeon]|nr:hypothetical protein [Euryarchaeota archaeon]